MPNPNGAPSGDQPRGDARLEQFKNLYQNMTMESFKKKTEYLSEKEKEELIEELSIVYEATERTLKERQEKRREGLKVNPVQGETPDEIRKRKEQESKEAGTSEGMDVVTEKEIRKLGKKLEKSSLKEQLIEKLGKVGLIITMAVLPMFNKNAKVEAEDKGKEEVVEILGDEKFYGESDPSKITIGSEHEVKEIENITGVESLDKLLNGSHKQFYLPGAYGYEKEQKTTMDAVGNPKKVLEIMGVDPENATPEDYQKAFEYIAQAQGFVPAGIAVMFDQVGKAPEGLGLEGKSYIEAQDVVYNLDEEGNKALTEWITKVFANSTSTFAEESLSKVHNFGDEKRSGEDGYEWGTFKTGDTRIRKVVKMEYTDPDDGTKVTFDFQIGCFNFGQTITVTKKDGKVYTITIPATPNDKPSTPSNPTPTPTPTPQPTPSGYVSKDSENLVRIDNNIDQTIGTNIGSEYVDNGYTYWVSPDDVTAPATSNDYGGTAPEIVQNTQSQEAEPVQYQISEENNYSVDLSPAIEVNNPVVANETTQEDANNRPSEKASSESAANEFGIN